MTEGIKLSNLYLRDGNDIWHSLKEAFIGDILGLESVEGENLEHFFQNLENYINWKILKLRIKNGRLILWNNEKNEEIDSVALNISPGSGGGTTYTIDVEKRTEGDEEVYYIVLNGEDGTKSSVPMPKQWYTKFWAEDGVGLFTKIREGNPAEGSGSNYTGDNSTITINANNVISLYNKGSIGPQLKGSQQLEFSSADNQKYFDAISNVVVDQYGRVVSISQKRYIMPSLSELMSDPDMENLIAQKVAEEIAQVVKITG